MQHRVIETVDFSHQPAQQGIAAFVIVAGQYPAGKKGDNRQRDDHRGGNRRDDGANKALGELTRALGQKEKREKRENQHASRAHHRHCYLFGAVYRRLIPAFAHPQMAGNIFDDDNRIVDQQAKRQNEPRDHELAHVEAHRRDSQQAGRQRQRDRNHYDNRRAPAQRQ